MKLLLLSLILFVKAMDVKEFENLIGQDISVANHILLDVGFEYKSLLGVNIYTSNDHKWFYGMPYSMISIMTDKNKIVKDIVIHFYRIIDSSFYDSFIIDYGKPDTIQVIDGYDSVGKCSETDPEEGFNHRVRKVTMEMREGKFEDGPLFMIWKKKEYEIKTLTKHEQSISEITFRLPTGKF